MVGDPKHLADLDKIEADVRIWCRGCGFEDDWTVADLSRHLFETGGSTVWSQVTRTLRCRRFGWLAERVHRWDDWGGLARDKGASALTAHLLAMIVASLIRTGASS